LFRWARIRSQHLELARDIAQRFNSIYGENVHDARDAPAAVGARIMGLDDPEKKMSKSTAGSGHAISLLDPPEVIRRKIMRSTTVRIPVSISKIREPACGICLTVFQAFTEWPDAALRQHFSGMRYGDLKKASRRGGGGGAGAGSSSVIARLRRKPATSPAFSKTVARAGFRPSPRDTVKQSQRSAMGFGSRPPV